MRTGLIGCALIAATACISDAQYVLLVEGPPRDAACDADPRALTMFDADLAGYGVWTDDASYGSVWTPFDASFVPYATRGRFARIDSELVWVSDEPWGRATLHHGRWVQLGDRWSWIPGMTYSPAWVMWDCDGERTSWRPTPPTFAWRAGTAYRVAPPVEPVVGTSLDTELALEPPERL